MKKITSLVVLSLVWALSLVYLAGCSKGPADDGGAPGTVRTTVYGRITDEAGMPVMGVTVAVGTNSKISDKNGFYIIQNASVPQGRALAIAKQNGYFTSARAVEPGSKGATRVDLVMMSNTATTTM